MIRTRYKILNALAIAGLLFFLCGLQTSFWYQFTGGAPAPQLWLLIIVYLTLYRDYFTAIFSSYALSSLVVLAFTAAPLGLFWSVLFGLVSISSFLKRRLFWSSARNFVIGAVGMTTLYHILMVVFSRVLERDPSPFQVGTRLSEIALSSLCALPVFWVMQSLDRWTLREIISNE